MSTAQRPDMTIAISLTDKAIAQVKSFMEQENLAPDSGGLRVSVLPGGCSGFKYGLNIEDRPLDDDIVFETQGLRVFIDEFSAQYVNGTVVDYVSSMQGAGFTFENPNASGGCGCGSSFTV